jgi:transcriptional regulator with XRE-family HTH domain
MSDVAKALGERLRAYRRRNGMTQEELAHRASCSVSYVSDLERAEKSPTIDGLIKLTDALGITLEELFANTQAGKKTKEAETVVSIIGKIQNLQPQELQTVNQMVDLLLSFRAK